MQKAIMPLGDCPGATTRPTELPQSKLPIPSVKTRKILMQCQITNCTLIVMEYLGQVACIQF